MRCAQTAFSSRLPLPPPPPDPDPFASARLHTRIHFFSPLSVRKQEGTRGTKGVLRGGTEVEEDKAVTPRRGSERIKVILSKRDMSCFCWVATKGLQRNGECAVDPLRIGPATAAATAATPPRCCVQVTSVPLPCVCVSDSPFRGLLRRRRSTFLPPGLPTPPPDPTNPSEGACDLLLRHNENNCISI